MTSAEKKGAQVWPTSWATARPFGRRSVLLFHTEPNHCDSPKPAELDRRRWLAVRPSTMIPAQSGLTQCYGVGSGTWTSVRSS